MLIVCACVCVCVHTHCKQRNRLVFKAQRMLKHKDSTKFRVLSSPVRQTLAPWSLNVHSDSPEICEQQRWKGFSSVHSQELNLCPQLLVLRSRSSSRQAVYRWVPLYPNVDNPNSSIFPSPVEITCRSLMC